MRLGSMKRDGGSRLPTGKRLAMSQPRPARRESPTSQEGREQSIWSPRARGAKSLEERVRAMEVQGAHDHKTYQALKAELDEHVKIALELRREVFTSRAALNDAMSTIETKFLTMEGQLEKKVATMDGQMAALQQTLDQAQAQAPMDGQVVRETFANLNAEIGFLKETKGETLTKPMLTALKVMEQRITDHERRIVEASDVDAHFGAHLNSLDEAYAQLLATLEPDYAPPEADSLPGWQRPSRRRIGNPPEYSYGGQGGHGGCSGSFCGGYGGHGGDQEVSG